MQVEMQRLVDLEKKKSEDLHEKIQKLEMNAKNREDEMTRLSLQLSQKQLELTQKEKDMMNQNHQKDLANSKLQELLEQTLNRVSSLESNMKAMTTPVKPAESVKKGSAKPEATPAPEVEEPVEDEENESSDGDEDEDDGWVTTPSGQQVPCCSNYILMTYKNGVVHDPIIPFNYDSIKTMHGLGSQNNHPCEVNITTDALRMRCRRLCQRTPAGKLQVDPAIAEHWRAGGEQREALEMALLESLSRFGTARSNYKRIKAICFDWVVCDRKVWWFWNNLAWTPHEPKPIENIYISVPNTTYIYTFSCACACD